MDCTIDKIRYFVERFCFYASIGDFENASPIYRQIIDLLASIQSVFYDFQPNSTHKFDEFSDEFDESSDDVR